MKNFERFFLSIFLALVFYYFQIFLKYLRFFIPKNLEDFKALPWLMIA